MTLPLKIIMFVAMVLFPSPLFADAASVEKWTVREYWGLLTAGMTEQIVLDVLGEPSYRESTGTSNVWYYSEAPERDGERIISRPRHGFLRFRVSTDSTALLRWTEPDWTTVTPRTETQYIREKQRIEAEARAEDQRLQSEEQARIRQAEQERLHAEREARQQQQHERAEQQRVVYESARQDREARQQESPSRQPPASQPYASHSRYWFTAAGVFIVMALLISITCGFKR